MDYLGTISDDSLGHISCIAASIVDGRIKIISGGSELRVWNEASIGKKRRARYIWQVFIYDIKYLFDRTLVVAKVYCW